MSSYARSRFRYGGRPHLRHASGWPLVRDGMRDGRARHTVVHRKSAECMVHHGGAHGGVKIAICRDIHVWQRLNSGAPGPSGTGGNSFAVAKGSCSDDSAAAVLRA